VVKTRIQREVPIAMGMFLSEISGESLCGEHNQRTSRTTPQVERSGLKRNDAKKRL